MKYEMGERWAVRRPNHTQDFDYSCSALTVADGGKNIFENELVKLFGEFYKGPNGGPMNVYDFDDPHGTSPSAREHRIMALLLFAEAGL